MILLAVVFAIWQPLGKPMSRFMTIWLAAFMLPVLHIFLSIAAFRADRYMYLPSVAVFTVLGIALMTLWERMQQPEVRYA